MSLWQHLYFCFRVHVSTIGIGVLSRSVDKQWKLLLRATRLGYRCMDPQLNGVYIRLAARVGGRRLHYTIQYG